MMSERKPQSKGAAVITTVQLSQQLRSELERVARLNDRSVSAEIRVALRNHLREYGPPALEPGDSPFPEAA